MSTFARKPPLRRDWTLANEVKRESFCRVCDKQFWEVKTIDLAHVLGREHDLKSVSEVELDDGRGLVRMAVVIPDRVLSLCGPQQETGTCHGLYDGHRLDIWELLTDSERAQAIEDAGGEGQALRRCAPLSWKTAV